MGLNDQVRKFVQKFTGNEQNSFAQATRVKSYKEGNVVQLYTADGLKTCGIDKGRQVTLTKLDGGSEVVSVLDPL